jgi:hypothetical protein
VIFTWVLVIGGAALLVLGIAYAWRNRPVRDAGDPEDGEQAYLSAFNIANAKDFGLYQRPRGDES